jgi:hypothetical protein
MNSGSILTVDRNNISTSLDKVWDSLFWFHNHLFKTPPVENHPWKYRIARERKKKYTSKHMHYILARGLKRHKT